VNGLSEGVMREKPIDGNAWPLVTAKDGINQTQHLALSKERAQLRPSSFMLRGRNYRKVT